MWRIDVLIGGAGFAGLALAIALRQALGPSFEVAVVDPALGKPSADMRASAIVANTWSATFAGSTCRSRAEGSLGV